MIHHIVLILALFLVERQGLKRLKAAKTTKTDTILTTLKTVEVSYRPLRHSDIIYTTRTEKCVSKLDETPG